MTLQVVFCAAEAAPFAKVGGLADVVGSLPRALYQSGVDVCVVLPRYGCINPSDWGLEKTGARFAVVFQEREEEVSLWQGKLPGCEVPVYLVENETWFGSRQSVYPVGEPQMELNSFLFFSDIIFEVLRQLEIRPDILHVHDWHTAPVTVKLSQMRREGDGQGYFSKTRSVLTIHNLSYQGHDGTTNWLAEGIRHADEITTVSPTYAMEIQTPHYGCGLDILLREHHSQIHGIVNGIDDRLFNPATDHRIAQQFDVESFPEGKAVCKADLQRESGLTSAPDRPLFGMVSRLVEQKGLDILLPALEVMIPEMDAQWVILGEGDSRYEEALKVLGDKFPNLAIYLGFNATLAQKIYAGSDFFLMPSRFEPCGLGQLIAMRYGSIPLVRATGGLADTVVDVQESSENSTGIVFRAFEVTALAEALRRAEIVYQQPQTRQQLVQNAMAADYSWSVSAKAYQGVYNSLVASSSADSAKAF